ncbi:MAG: hypothetical protein UU82_C0010G0020 [Candidatus Nomurabacteria bacterium GW2011_GWC2_41_8]|uniref:Uncharacterized protein n=3 Tax=Candidatus Nomuraibacteriota TaxID=1752729 RepID=A0A0G0XIB6_9BACT|nr:MAG: hypothetical protein UU58_C0004G0018 [Candidatus Nomurabacteria bacterium GW2011_GWA2_41_25]KKS24172.1 MAG: hypothetical protein UU82_C0010G0020 [Candidatus Nomurabacteria bacterium GW2011_GWC2_41_8]
MGLKIIIKRRALMDFAQHDFVKSIMKKLFKIIPILFFTILFPIIALADFVGPCPTGTHYTISGCVPDGLGGILYNISKLLNLIIPVLLSLGVVYFVWGVVRYVIGDSEEAKKKGRDRMIYGIIGLTVITSLWGLVNIVVETFGIGGASAPSLEPLTGPASTCNLAGNPKFQDLLCYITRIINDSVIPLIFALATVMFVWGMVNFFILNADEEVKRAQGKQFMIWGIVALAVMLSVWGLVGILGSTFNVDSSILPQVTPP